MHNGISGAAPNPLDLILGLGNLLVATSGTDGYEFQIIGVKHPKQAKDLIMERKKAMRLKQVKETNA